MTPFRKKRIRPSGDPSWRKAGMGSRKINPAFLRILSRLYPDHVSGQNKSGNRFAMEMHTFRADVSNEPIFTSILSPGEPSMKEDRSTQAPEVPVELFKLLGHDVRNALTSIQLLTQIALRHQETQTAEQLRSFLTKIDGQSAKLAGLVNELLDVARIQAGRLNLQKQQVDLEGFLGEVSRRAAAAITGPEISWGPPPAAQVELDQARIQQAVTCILLHGARDIPGVTAIGVRSGILHASLEISMEFRHARSGDETKVFRELNGTRGDDPLPAPGLFIAAEIIRLHGGTVRTETADDTLTTVHLTLPVSS